MTDFADAVDLRHQVAVVTGGGRGLGRAFALALAAAGATVAVIARSATELAETVALVAGGNGRAHAFAADITDAAALHGRFAEIERSLGPVDLLVNNAGALGPIGPFWETSVEEWWRVMEVNLRGQVLCARAVLPGMIARRRGRIVNLASGAGARPIAYFSGYVASKTAVLRFTECVAAEARPYGVALFAMGPGTVRTRLSEQSLESPEGRKWLPWFRRIFDERLDLPAERPAQLLLALASGKLDALSGRFLQPADDLAAIARRAADVESEQLYVLRVRGLAEPTASPVFAAIAAAAERGAARD